MAQKETEATIRLKLYGEPIATAQENKVDIITCIRSFDAGCDVIYLTDENNNYTGRAILKSKFCEIFTGEGNIVQNIPFIDNVILTEEHNDSSFLQRITDYFVENPDWSELPVTSEGRVTLRLAKEKNGQQEVSELPSGYLLPELYKYGKIYLSSLENPMIRAFYRKWGGQFPMYPLVSDNLNEALSTSGSLLIYAEDVFPACTKVSIEEIFRVLEMTEKAMIAGSIFFRESWGSVPMAECHNPAKFIERFDEGYESVVVEAPDGQLISVVERDRFAKAFPGTTFVSTEISAVPYHEDNKTLRALAAAKFYHSKRKEIPVVWGNRVVASAVLAVERTGRKELRERQPLRWEYISDEVAMAFFGNCRRILLSSGKGCLQGFAERFSSLLEIGISTENFWKNCFEKRYDMLIYAAPCWEDLPMPMYSAEKLYSQLLAEEIRRQLARKHVSFHWFDYLKHPTRMEGRTTHEQYCSLPSIAWDGTKNVWYHFADAENVAGGCRMTAGVPETYRNSVYVFGPCIAAGDLVKEEETLESFLQARLRGRFPYRVVNCGVRWIATGMEFSYVNNLYRLVDMELRSGDVVLQFVEGLQRETEDAPIIARENYHEVRTPFDFPENRNAKCFAVANDGATPAHLNGLGNEILANYIYSVIEPEIQEKQNSTEEEPFSLFSELPPSEAVESLPATPELSAYLEELGKHRVEAERVGAIVMNCNPFTKGHAYLVEKAREAVDFLFLFVVEEDLSAFPFSDRISIVRENCGKDSKIKVLPSGKYMISRVTFGEYFSKESLQNQEVHPANDVNLFARHIAPCLGITTRFVGEEPTDQVTRQYNAAMKEILPRHGVNVVEIPRLTGADGIPVSATKVRALLKANQLKRCRPLLTEATYLYLERHWKRIRMIFKEE